MNKPKLSFTLSVLLISLVILTPPIVDAADSIPRKVLIGFNGAPGVEAGQLVESMGGHVIIQYSLIPAMAAEIPVRAVSALASHPMVAYVEPDYPRYLTSHIIVLQAWSGSPEIVPWGVDKVGADDVWSSDGGQTVDVGAVAGQGVLVAVLDTGIDLGHPDLMDNLVPLPVYCSDICDFIDMDSDPSDTPGPFQGHGSLTSGNIAAVDNEIGVIGVAPKASIMMYRVCDSTAGICPTSAIVAGIQAAVADGAQIISMSFGGPAAARAERVAIRQAFLADVVLVASSGNAGRPPVNFPAALPEVIAVGATDITDTIAGFSSFGHDQELTAPGVDVPSTTVQGIGREALFSVESGFTPGGRQTNPMEFSALGTVSSQQMRFVGLGTASEVAAECSGNPCTGQLALIKRGAITFQEKVANSAAAGFAGAVVFNNQPGNFFGTLQAPSSIPAGSLSFEDGDPLRATIQSGPMVFGSLSVTAIDYESASGTSFSAPYVSGVAALVRSKNPSLSNVQVRNILDSTAVDFGKTGYDFVYGFGRVDAAAAVAATPSP